VYGVHDLYRGVAGAGQVVGRDTPNARDVLPRCWIGEAALSRELIALLSVFASVLAVALASDHDGARAFASDISSGQRDCDRRLAILDAFGLVLQTARMEDHRAPRFADPMRGLFDGLGRHAGHAGRAPRIPGLDRFGGLLEAGSMRLDERPVG